jgi:hypothetical protein
MKMKRVKVLLISVLLLTILSINLADTYGLFETKAKAETIMSVGKWNVTLNDTDITLKQKVSFDDFVFTGSSHTEEGYLAPGSTGTFDLNIDVSECDTSVEYNLSFDTTKFEEHPNIELKILDEDTNEEVSDGVLTGVIKLSDPNKVKNIKIKIIWNDVEEYNENDSKLIGESLDIVINSNFRQYT